MSKPKVDQWRRSDKYRDRHAGRPRVFYGPIVPAPRLDECRRGHRSLQTRAEEIRVSAAAGPGAQRGAPVMLFGKHAGVPLAELPGGYLSWLETKLDTWRDPFRSALVAELARRNGGGRGQERKPVGPSAPTAASTADHRPASPVRQRAPRRPAPELPAPTVCDRCGLPAMAQKPLVHEACLHDEAPF